MQSNDTIAYPRALSRLGLRVSLRVGFLGRAVGGTGGRVVRIGGRLEAVLRRLRRALDADRRERDGRERLAVLEAPPVLVLELLEEAAQLRDLAVLPLRQLRQLEDPRLHRAQRVLERRDQLRLLLVARRRVRVRTHHRADAGRPGAGLDEATDVHVSTQLTHLLVRVLQVALQALHFARGLRLRRRALRGRPGRMRRRLASAQRVVACALFDRRETPFGTGSGRADEQSPAARSGRVGPLQVRHVDRMREELLELRALERLDAALLRAASRPASKEAQSEAVLEVRGRGPEEGPVVHETGGPEERLAARVRVPPPVRRDQ